MYCKKNALYITDREAAKRISAAVLDGELIGIYAQGDHAENAVKNSKEMFSDEVCICNTIEGSNEVSVSGHSCRFVSCDR